MRRLLPLLLAAGLLSACSATGTPAPDAATAVRDEVLDELRGEVATVARAQADADEALNDVLAVVRAVDEAVAALERVPGFDEQLAAHDEVHQQVEATQVQDLREGWFDVAATVDDARNLLAGAREHLDDDWEVSYLDAQDEVLVSVREYAEVADRVAQLVIQHWPTYREVDARIAEFAPRRGNYRDAEEARDALAVELDTVLRDLLAAEQQLADERQERRAAGETVNAASADAVSIYEQRPQGAATGGRR